MKVRTPFAPFVGLTDAEVVAALREGKLGKLAAERTTPQRRREDLRAMTPEAVVKASAAGQCDDLLGIRKKGA